MMEKRQVVHHSFVGEPHSDGGPSSSLKLGAKLCLSDEHAVRETQYRKVGIQTEKTVLGEDKIKVQVEDMSPTASDRSLSLQTASTR